MRTKTQKYVITKDGSTLPERSKLSFDNMTDYIAENGNSTAELETFVETHNNDGIAEAREYFLKKYFAEEYATWEANYLSERSAKAKEAKKKLREKKLADKFQKLKAKETANE